MYKINTFNRLSTYEPFKQSYIIGKEDFLNLKKFKKACFLIIEFKPGVLF